MADITKIYSIGIAIVTGLALVGGVVAFMQARESSTRFIVGAQMSLSFLRMISYALFAFMIFGLLKYQLMSLPSLSVGLGLAMICFISFGFYAMVKTSQRTKHFFGKVS